MKVKVISWSRSSQGHSHFEVKVILESNGNVFGFLFRSGRWIFGRMSILLVLYYRVGNLEWVLLKTIVLVYNQGSHFSGLTKFPIFPVYLKQISRYRFLFSFNVDVPYKYPHYSLNNFTNEPGVIFCNLLI